MIKLKYPNFWSTQSWLSFIMMPFSYIYLFLGFLRTKFTKKIILPQKVICVGNITVGGAGKTQIVIWLAEILKQKKHSFVIVTKAYRSELKGAKLVGKADTAKEIGDESIMLKQYDYTVIAARKIEYALPLIDRLNPEIVILDDGMQNPLLKKDFQILAIDSLNAVGNNRIFPAGPLRETLKSGLTKSDLIFIIGNNECRDFNLINNINLSQKPYCKASIKLIPIPILNKTYGFKAEPAQRSDLREHRRELKNSNASFKRGNGITENLDKNVEYIAFAGIGNPEKFYSLLSENNFKIKQSISFEDHHNYSDSDIKKLIDLAKLNNCFLITTEKDYIKIDNKYKSIIICAKVKLQLDNEQKTIDLIYEKLFQKN